MKNALSSAEATLKDLKSLHTEAALLSRYLYKFKRLFRHDKGLRCMVKVRISNPEQAVSYSMTHSALSFTDKPGSSQVFKTEFIGSRDLFEGLFSVESSRKAGPELFADATDGEVLPPAYLGVFKTASEDNRTVEERRVLPLRETQARLELAVHDLRPGNGRPNSGLFHVRPDGRLRVVQRSATAFARPGGNDTLRAGLRISQDAAGLRRTRETEAGDEETRHRQDIRSDGHEQPGRQRKRQRSCVGRDFRSRRKR